jgi:hypothetical protein
VSTSPSGPVRPARLAGFILLGVAVVAVGLGIFALADSASGQTASPSTNTVTAPETISPTTAKQTTTAKPTTSAAPSTTAPSTSYPSGQTTTVLAAPGATTSPTGPPPVMVRVYNNSYIKNLAAQAAADLRNAGFDVVQIGGYSQGIIPASTAYYSPLPGEQQTAEAIAQRYSMRALPRFPGIADASPGVIVIVTKDFKG